MLNSLDNAQIYADAHFVLAECDADFQGRGTQAGKVVKMSLCLCLCLCFFLCRCRCSCP